VNVTPKMINNIMHSWASINVTIEGVPEVNITAIEYSDKEEIENIYGASRFPIGRGYGRVTASASITLHMESVESIRKSSITGRLQDIAPFDISVSYIKAGGAQIITHVIKNCQFLENTYSSKEGDLKVEVTLPLLPSHIIWNTKI